MPHDEHRELSSEELEAQAGAELPDREAMSLLNLDVDLALDADLSAPVNAAVAANANVAAPIDAAVSANVGSPDAISMASAEQDATIVQHLEGEANAESNQTSAIGQGEAAEPESGQAEPAPVEEPATAEPAVEEPEIDQPAAEAATDPAQQQ
jgi:hypothetical protein